jgi:secretion/DNA translocation related TadE-like protein
MTADVSDVDGGSSGLLLLVGILLVAAAATVMAGLVAATISHTAAESAADMTALAVAGRILTDADPCASGATIAAANESQLAECSVLGATVSVAVTRPLPPVLQRLLPGRQATGTARAELRVDWPALPSR